MGKFEDTLSVFLKELRGFDHDLSSLDPVWNLIFPDRNGAWRHVAVSRYRQVFYLSHIDGNACSLEAASPKKVRVAEGFGPSYSEEGRDDPGRVWEPILTAARRWLKRVQKRWIFANKQVALHYPLNRRYGTVPHAVIRGSLPGMYRLDRDLGRTKCRRFIRLVEEGYFRNEENTTAEAMSARDFFNYCRIAYIAGKRKEDHVNPRLSGREMYERYADGRHEGLLDIDPVSQREFADWIDGKHPKRTVGGHPWEIRRGGNTTHIDLNVYRPSFGKKGGFKIELRAASISRLAEAVCMFLAIHDASLPISIADPEGIRKRLLAQDAIGIIPAYASLHRANQHFSREQSVYDVLHYDDLGRYKRGIKPFINWEPLPLFKPKHFNITAPPAHPLNER